MGDHAVLDALTAEIRAALAGEGGRNAGPDLVAARLDQLRGRLSAHFDEEERAGLLDQVVVRLPRRKADCDRLRADHHQLLDALDRLRSARAEARRDPAWAGGVRFVLDQLGKHEALEDEILIEILEQGDARG